MAIAQNHRQLHCRHQRNLLKSSENQDENRLIFLVCEAPLLPNLGKSIAGPGLVAYTITAKYCDHLPLYRQVQIWQRYGMDIPRNTLCDWLMKTAEQCEPLWELLGKHIVANDYIQADESPVQVLSEPDCVFRRRGPVIPAEVDQSFQSMWTTRSVSDDLATL